MLSDETNSRSGKANVGPESVAMSGGIFLAPLLGGIVYDKWALISGPSSVVDLANVVYCRGGYYAGETYDIRCTKAYWTCKLTGELIQYSQWLLAW